MGGGYSLGWFFWKVRGICQKNNAWFLKHWLEVNIIASCVFWGGSRLQAPTCDLWRSSLRRLIEKKVLSASLCPILVLQWRPEASEANQIWGWRDRVPLIHLEKTIFPLVFSKNVKSYELKRSRVISALVTLKLNYSDRFQTSWLGWFCDVSCVIQRQWGMEPGVEQEQEVKMVVVEQLDLARTGSVSPTSTSDSTEVDSSSCSTAAAAGTFR